VPAIRFGTVPVSAVRHGADIDERCVSTGREPHPNPESGGGPQGAARLPRPAVGVPDGCGVYLRCTLVGLLLPFCDPRQSPGHGTWARAVAAYCRPESKTYTLWGVWETPHIPPIALTHMRHKMGQVSHNAARKCVNMCQHVSPSIVNSSTPSPYIRNHQALQ
jgi:hypothetical protein